MSLTSRVLKSGTLVAAALATAALGGAATTVFGQAMPPSARVFGSITLNGTNAPSGAVVTAYSGSTLCGTASGAGLYNGTQYFVDLDSSQAACATPGNTITFKINGQAANETIAVPAIDGSAVQQNLSGPASGGGTAAAGTATYSPGWNLVGGPGGTTFSAASNPLYTFQAGATEYAPVQNTTAVNAGQGYWAYFTTTTTVNLGASATLPFTVSVPAGQYIQIANPSSTKAVTVSGADVVYTWDPVANNYAVNTTLQPGQGAWVFSNAGGSITMQ